MTDTTAITNHHDLQRRRSALSDLQKYVAGQEREFQTLRSQLQCFVDRYTAALGPLYMELDALESGLYTATHYLAEALRRNGVDARIPKAPKATDLPKLPLLPAGAPLLPEPAGGMVELAPPTLKTLYRRAAKRLHPDHAPNERQRQQREQQMMVVNEAYARGDMALIKKLLLAAGEDPVKVNGGSADAMRDWLTRSEVAVQGRLRVVQAHLVQLQLHSMHKLWQAVTGAEAQGLDPLEVMSQRLRSQITERRQELYIGQRLQPESTLTVDFLRQRGERSGGTRVH